MAMEKRLGAIPFQLFTEDGTARGKIVIATTFVEIPGNDPLVCLPFKVKQRVVIRAIGESNLTLEVKRVAEDEKTLYVGPLKDEHGANTGTSQYRDGSINSRTDLSAYTVAKSASIEAEDQQKPKIPEQEVERNTYEQEPTNARRSYLVDEWGRPYRKDNPFPVDITDLDVTVDVNLPNKVHIQNIPVLLANTEFSISLPTNTKTFMIKIRDAVAPFRIAFISGDTVNNYIQVRRGRFYTAPDVDTTAGTQIYVQLPLVGAVVEVISWYS